MAVPEKHFVNGNRLAPPFPAGLELALFGMGCFWGAERLFWELPGVWSTSVGYAGGFTPNPTYPGSLHAAIRAIRKSSGSCSIRRRSAIQSC